MLGVFPTWFQVRERGKQYAIAVRAQMVEPEVWGLGYDPQERSHLTHIHNVLMDRCNVNPWTVVVNPEYDWYLETGLRYYYHAYLIPFPWRQPFLQWLNKLVGPDGSKPTVPHNIRDPNVFDPADPWGRTITWTEATRPTRFGARVQTVAARPAPEWWNLTWTGGTTNNGGINGGGTV
jgi:hypothetical protein